MFRSLTTERPRYFTDPGRQEANDYQVIIDKKGHKTLKLVGTHNIYEEIQSYAEECKIENIIARAAAGDLQILNMQHGIYADITDAPKNLAEAQDAILKLSQSFDELPAEIRNKFGNSKERFVQEFGSEDWFNNMGFNQKEEVTTEVTFTGEKVEDPLTPEA